MKFARFPIPITPKRLQVRPLGELITLQGHLVEGPFKGLEGGPNLIIQRVNGVATQEGAQIVLRNFWEESVVKSLQRGRSYELRGFETGEYVGHPAGAQLEANVVLQAPGFYFRLSFVVISRTK